MPSLAATARYLAISATFCLLWINLHWAAVVFEAAPGASVWYPARGLRLALLLVFAVVSLLLSAAVADRRRSLEALANAHRADAERARREAEHVRQSKARFLAATTHDLPQPHRMPCATNWNSWEAGRICWWSMTRPRCRSTSAWQRCASRSCRRPQSLSRCRRI
jgi:hypothetical protein